MLEYSMNFIIDFVGNEGDLEMKVFLSGELPSSSSLSRSVISGVAVDPQFLIKLVEMFFLRGLITTSFSNSVLLVKNVVVFGF